MTGSRQRRRASERDKGGPSAEGTCLKPREGEEPEAPAEGTCLMPEAKGKDTLVEGTGLKPE